MRFSRPRAGLVLLLLLPAACSRDPETVKKRYVQSGNEYFKNGKFAEASLMYRSALKKDLRYGEAYYRLGLTDIRLGRYADAMRSLRRAIELQPGNIDALTSLADIYLVAYLTDTRRPKGLLNELEAIAKPLLQKDPRSFLGLRLQGYIAISNKDMKEAIRCFQTANEVKPFQQDVVLALAEALATDDQFPAAEKLANELRAREKTNASICDWLYVQYVRRNRIQDAERVLLFKIENNPKVAQYMIGLAGHYFAAQRRDEMVKTLDKLTSNPKDFPNAHQLVGDFYVRIRDLDKALAQYQEGLKGDRSFRGAYQKSIVQVLITQGKKQDALDLVNQILKENPKDSDATALRASMWLGEGDRNKVQQAINDLQGVVSRNPDNFVLRFNLGRAHMAKGDVEQARVQFQEAIKRRADYTPARLALAQLNLSRNEFAKGLQAADEILAYDPNNMTARLIRTSCKMGLGDYETARSELGEIQKLYPRSLDAQFQIGMVNFHEKKYKEAEDAFKKLHEEAPADPRGLLGMVETNVYQGRFDPALKLLEGELARAPERGYFRLALANTAVRAKQYDRAIREYKSLLEREPRNYDVWLRLGETYRFKGDIPNAIEGFNKAKELSPVDPVPYVRLGLLLESVGRTPEAKAIYEQVLKMEPDNYVALNNLAYMLAEQGQDLDTALTYAQRAKAKMPSSLDISDTLGWVYIKKNLSDNAIQIFRDLVSRQPTNPTFRYHLAMALFQKGEKPLAKKELQDALRNNPTKEDETKMRELMAKLGP